MPQTMTKAGRQFARQDDERQRENAEDHAEQRKLERQQQSLEPAWGIHRQNGQFFWAVWTQRRDAACSDCGVALTHEAALKAVVQRTPVQSSKMPVTRMSGEIQRLKSEGKYPKRLP